MFEKKISGNRRRCLRRRHQAKKEDVSGEDFRQKREMFQGKTSGNRGRCLRGRLQAIEGDV